MVATGPREVLKKAMKNKEHRVRSCTSRSEVAGAQSTCDPLSFAVKILLHLRRLCHNLEAGYIHLFNDSEHKRNTPTHFKYLCPVPKLSPFQKPGLPLLWQRDNPADSDTQMLKHFC